MNDFNNNMAKPIFTVEVTVPVETLVKVATMIILVLFFAALIKKL